jgi:hypothetical protein
MTCRHYLSNHNPCKDWMVTNLNLSNHNLPTRSSNFIQQPGQAN